MKNIFLRATVIYNNLVSEHEDFLALQGFSINMFHNSFALCCHLNTFHPTLVESKIIIKFKQKVFFNFRNFVTILCTWR